MEPPPKDAKVYTAIRDMTNRELVAVLEDAGEVIPETVARSASALSDIVRSKYQEGALSSYDILTEYGGGL